MSAERAAIYCRLSQEDRDKNDPSDDSRSIANQKSLLLQYASDHGWQVTEIYSDEDYSGSDRNRPAFQRMIADAKQGKFDLILCKSQSRFTREMELVEKYIHDLFPQWGVRLVGVADHVDSSEISGRKARQLSGLINQWYLEDLSDSIRTVLRSRQRQGLHIGSFAPYGYRKDTEHPGVLLPDDEAGKIVRRIFEAYADGKGKGTIAGQLNREQVPNPSLYKRLKGSHYRSRYPENPGLWRSSTVDSILRNPVYIGTVAQHRSEKISYKSKVVRSLPKEQWLTMEHRHEPLIPRELWDAVQMRLEERSTASFGGRTGIFAGKLRCLYCGQSMRRCKAKGDRFYYRCGGAQIHSGCTGAFIPYHELRTAIWHQFQRELSENFREDFLAERDTEPLRQQLQVKIQAEKRLEFQLINGTLSEEWAAEFRQELKMQQVQLQNKIEKLERQNLQLPLELNRAVVEAFVDYIAVGKRNKETGRVPIEIHWRF